MTEHELDRPRDRIGDSRAADRAEAERHVRGGLQVVAKAAVSSLRREQQRAIVRDLRAEPGQIVNRPQQRSHPDHRVREAHLPVGFARDDACGERGGVVEIDTRPLRIESARPCPTPRATRGVRTASRRDRQPPDAHR